MPGCAVDIIMLKTWNNCQELESIGFLQGDIGVEIFGFSLNLDFLCGVWDSLYGVLIFCLFSCFKHVLFGHWCSSFSGAKPDMYIWHCTGHLFDYISSLSLVEKVSAFLKCVHGDEVDIQRFTCGFDRTSYTQLDRGSKSRIYFSHLFS